MALVCGKEARQDEGDVPLAKAEAKRAVWGRRTRMREVRMYYCQQCRATHNEQKEFNE